MARPKELSRIKRKTIRIAFFDAPWFESSDGMLEVSVSKVRKGQWQVSVWGPDDMGVSRRGTQDTCLSVFDQVTDGTTRQALTQLGFTEA